MEEQIAVVELCKQYGSFDDKQNRIVNKSEISNVTLEKGIDVGDQVTVEFNPSNSTSYVSVVLRNRHIPRPWLLKAQVTLNRLNVGQATKHLDNFFRKRDHCHFLMVMMS
uniref:Uncharacterized protein n=1 Tax=Romanomermis culicivorax TaxID=13658 RepID=A0A915KMC9_ROMCU